MLYTEVINFSKSHIYTQTNDLKFGSLGIMFPKTISIAFCYV